LRWKVPQGGGTCGGFSYQGDDPGHNTATALHEFLSELEAWCPPE
jgi:hypothetical protein